MSIKNTAANHEADQAISQALEKMRGLLKKILEARVNDEHIWFRNLLVGILNCALLDYYNVEVGIRKSIYMAAWGCRNLLELKVITKYVLASEANAADFKNDLLIDAKEFYEAMTRWHKASHKRLVAMLSEMAQQEKGQMKEALTLASRRESERGPQTDATHSETETYKQLMLDFGIKENTKPKRASEIARKIRENEAFDPMFKICSKVMHRTALSIASSTTRGSLDEAIPFLSSSGAYEMLLIYESISTHFEKNGVQPPEN